MAIKVSPASSLADCPPVGTRCAGGVAPRSVTAYAGNTGRCGEIMRSRSARIEPYTDADIGQLSAEFAQVILQVIAIAQRKYHSKIAALESNVSELRLSNQALELELAQVKSRVLAADRQASPVAEVASTLSSTDRPSLQRSSDLIDQADQVTAADTDKDGIITVEMLQTTGIDWPRRRMEKLLGALDEDGNGAVLLEH